MAIASTPGAVVAWWDGNALAFGTVLALDKQRVRLALPRGGEEKILPARVAFEIERPAGAAGDRAAAERRAAAAAEKVEAFAALVDVPVLWELAGEGGGAADLDGLAALALGASGGKERAALCVAFAREGIRFHRRGEDWEARDAAQVAELTRQRARESERAEERRRFVEALAAVVAGGAWVPSGSETERRGLKALTDFAVLEVSAPESSREAALSILEVVAVPGDRPFERAFRLLRRLGVFDSDDENLHVRRLGLSATFPEAVSECASAAARRGWSKDDREDLTGLTTVTIDGPSTRDLDDALSFEPDGAGGCIGIHVADPSAFVLPRDPVDAEAMSRVTSHYLPDLRVPMLPAVLSEDAASLVAGAERPALSFFVDLAPDGEWKDFSIRRSVIRPRARLDYAAADETIATGGGPFEGLLRALDRMAAALELRRAARGALILKAREVGVRVDPTGAIALELVDSGSRSRRLVSEAMVLAGEAAARFCIERGIPSLFRRQPPPVAPIVLPPGAESDPVAVRAARMRLRRGEVSSQPGPHFALGLPAYSQVTSPLRRYQDLTVHRQISAALQGVPPPFGADEIQTVAATTERAESAARDAERMANRYWLLRHLEKSAAKTVAAVVVAVEPTVVQLTETLLEERVAGLTAVQPGDRVVLAVVRVNPRADLLVLRPE